MGIFKDENNEVFNWVVNNLKNGEDYKNDLTIAITLDNLVIAGVIYSLQNGICYLSIYSTSPKWASHLSKIFEIALNFSPIVKCLTSSKNKKINKFLQGIGMVKEGVLRFERADGTHSVVWSLTEKELKKKRWFK